MAEYFLVGNLDDNEDLWFISKRDGAAVPVPKECWLSVISMFQSDAVGASPEHERSRDSLAQSIIDNVQQDNAVSRNVFLSFSTSELGRVVMTKRSHPIDRLFQDNDRLANLLRKSVDRGS
jgi:hypothetical protein